MKRTVSFPLAATGFFKQSVLTLGVLLGTVSVCNATILGFAQVGGSNTNLNGTGYGSAAAADAPGLTVSNGTTPDVSLVWENNWDIHTSGHFSEIEDLSVGGLWDNEGGTRIGQLDASSLNIDFSVNSGYAVVINSFDFGNTEETKDVSDWVLSIMNSSDVVVWTQSVTLDNEAGGGSLDALNIAPNFTGLDGASYTLHFEGTNALNGRHAIDNLSFSQVAVPEPTSLVLALLGLAACGLGRRRA